MKQIFFFFVSMIILTILGALPGFAEGADSLSIILSKTPKVNGLEIRVNDNETDNSPIVIGGREAWEGKKDLGNGLFMMYFTVKNPEFQDRVAPEVYIEVDYFDESAGQCILEYDSSDAKVQKVSGILGAFKPARPFQLAGAHEWKTMRFHIKDAQFSQRCNDADFRLIFTGGARPIVGAVRVTKTGVSLRAKHLNPQPPPGAPNCLVVRDVQYGKAGDIPLLMNMTFPNPKPKKPVPAIIFLHGGGWSGGSRLDMMPRCFLVSQAGYIGASVEYRLTGQSPFPAQLHDCKGAVRFLRANAKKYGIDPARIGVWGCSAGGHLAAMMGLTEGIAEFEGDCGNPGVSSRVQMVVDCFGPTDLDAWQETVNKFADDPQACKLFAPPIWDSSMAQPPIWGDAMFQWWKNFGLNKDLGMIQFFKGNTAADRAKWASPITYASRKVNVPPFLFVHGSLDTWVPLQQSILLANALKKNGANVTFLLEINVDHDDSPAFPEILEYIKKTFPLTKATSGQNGQKSKK
jgi:acetyl esterase/lipase